MPIQGRAHFHLDRETGCPWELLSHKSRAETFAIRKADQALPEAPADGAGRWAWGRIRGEDWWDPQADSQTGSDRSWHNSTPSKVCRPRGIAYAVRSDDPPLAKARRNEC